MIKYLIYGIILHFANGQDISTSDVLNTVTNIIEISSKIGGAVAHAQNVKESLNPERVQTFHQASDDKKSIWQEISDCDPAVKGLCCLAPRYCAPQATCYSNKPGLSLASVVTSIPYCECPPGYRGDGYRSGTGCENIDECFDGTHKCQHYCEDRDPGYKCSCQSGYRLGADNMSCEDIDECAEGTSGCIYGCENTLGSYQCTCPPGMLLDDDQRGCQDIDECALMVELEEYKEALARNSSVPPVLSELAELARSTLTSCEYAHLCQNLPGRFKCNCPYGFKIDLNRPTHCVDIDECEENIPKEYTERLAGYVLPTDFQPTCSNKYDDSVHAKKCTNTNGGFHCSCKNGYQAIPFSPPRSFFETVENTTYNVYKDAYLFNMLQQHLIVCKDVNECDEDPQPCTAQAETSSGRESSRRSLEGAADSAASLPVASVSSIEKSSDAPPVSFETLPVVEQSKEPVLNLPEVNTKNEKGVLTAEDTIVTALVQEFIDHSLEFAASDPLVGFKSESEGASDGICKNEIGTFKCTCRHGFEFDYENKKCTEIDACANHECHPNEMCQRGQFPGTYRCGCKPGFKPVTDLTTYDPSAGAIAPQPFCVRANPCELPTHDCQYQCVETITGGFTCRCPPGYAFNDRTRRCENINECALHVCYPNSLCFDLPGSYMCSCAANMVPAPADNKHPPLTQVNPVTKDILRIIDEYAYAQETVLDWRNPVLQNIRNILQQQVSQNANCKAVNKCELLATLNPKMACPNNLVCKSDNNHACGCASGYELKPIATRTPKATEPPLLLSESQSRKSGYNKQNYTDLYRSVIGTLKEHSAAAAVTNPSASQLGQEPQELMSAEFNELFFSQRLAKKLTDPTYLKQVIGEEEFERFQLNSPFELNSLPLHMYLQLDLVDYYQQYNNLRNYECVDIDECLTSPCGYFNCCINTPGGYKCKLGILGKCVF